MKNKFSKIDKKRGNAFGFFFFKMLFKIFGLKIAYSFLYIVCFYYLLFDREAVRKTLPYIKRRFPSCGKAKNYIHIYRLFISQGMQLIDRYVYVANPDFFQFEIKQKINVLKVVKEAKNGLILLTSHVGNWQISLGSLNLLNIRQLNLLIRPEENEAIKKTLDLNNDSSRLNYISTDKEFGGILEIYNALRRGEVVTMMGDRNYGAKTVSSKFLGDPAYFPKAAFHIASTVNCPVILLYVVKESSRKYFSVEKILLPDTIKNESKENGIASLLADYIKELEKFTEKYPYQCFIFDDIWKK